MIGDGILNYLHVKRFVCCIYLVKGCQWHAVRPNAVRLESKRASHSFPYIEVVTPDTNKMNMINKN